VKAITFDSAMIEHPAFHALSIEAQACLIVVKATLGPEGIGRIWSFREQIAYGIGKPVAIADKGLSDLALAGWLEHAEAGGGSEIWWLTEAFDHYVRHATGRRDNLLGGCRYRIESLPQAHVVVVRFLARYSTLLGLAAPSVVPSLPVLVEAASTPAPKSKAVKSKAPESTPEIDDAIAKYKTLYPRRAGPSNLAEGEKRLRVLIATGKLTAAQVPAIVKAYAKDSAENIGTSFIQKASTFWGQKETWKDYVPMDRDAQRLLDEAQAKADFDSMGR